MGDPVSQPKVGSGAGGMRGAQEPCPLPTPVPLPAFVWDKPPKMHKEHAQKPYRRGRHRNTHSLNAPKQEKQRNPIGGAGIERHTVCMCPKPRETHTETLQKGQA